jgi:Tfp pilus assembly protein PilF
VVDAGGGELTAVDGKIQARRDALNWSEAGYLNLWSVALRPSAEGITGAPLVTRGGRVAGMCDFTNNSRGQVFAFAIPENALAAILAKARAALQPLPFPKPGEVNPRSNVAINADPDYIAAMGFTDTGNLYAAEEKFRAALKSHPQSALAMGQLAHCVANHGDLAEAQKLLEAAIQLAPERVMAHVQLGEILTDQGDAAKTLKYFQNLVTKYPKLGLAWGSLAKCQWSAGQRDEAVKAAKKWTELEPESRPAWTLLAEILGGTGDWDGRSAARNRANEIESLLFRLRYNAPHRE